MFSTCIKDAEIKYYQELFENKKHASLNFWKGLGKSLGTKNKPRSNISKLIIDGNEITDDNAMSNAMNDYFCSIGQNIANTMNSGNTDFRQYLQNRIQNTFYLKPIIPNDVLKEIDKLKTKKSSGPDNLPNKIIKESKYNLIEPLTILYNSVFLHAKYPDKWKLAKVIALHKKGSLSLPENYRPISLLDCFGKILERLIYKQMFSFITKYSILFIYQYGFRHGHSTTLALIDIIDTIKKRLDNGDYGIGIFIDIKKKAFDTVNHEILLTKLEHYGFRGHSLQLLQSYVSDRKQYTRINGVTSTVQSLNYGVPQGSVLGPLLFLLYVNDIQYCIDKNKIKLFADDTGIFQFNRNLNELRNEASRNLSKIYDWFSFNRLALSLEKSHFLIFHSKRKKIDDNIEKLQFGNNSIPRAYSTKYIGMTIDENLSWDLHINGILKSLYRYYSLFYHMRHFVNHQLIRTIYYSCVYSRIQYGIEVFGMCNSGLINKLQVIQNKLLRILGSKDRYYSTHALHKEFDILTVLGIRNMLILKFVYNCVNGDPVDAFKNYFKRPSHSYGTSQAGNLLREPIRTESYGRSTTHFTGATLWNELPLSLKARPSLDSFKYNLKKFLQNK